MQYILFSQNAIRTAHIKHDKLAYLAPLWRQIFFPRYPKAPKEKTWGWNQADHGLKKSPNCARAKKGAVIRQFRFVKVNHFPKGYTIAAICSKGGLRGAHIIPKGGWFYYHHMCTHKSLYGKKNHPHVMALRYQMISDNCGGPNRIRTKYRSFCIIYSTKSYQTK